MFRFNKHLIVIGSARSGTSWISELLAQRFRYRMLFEPEQEFKTTHGHLVCDKYITSKKEASEAYKYLKQVFANRVNSDWIAQNSNRKYKMHLWPFLPKKYIIKFVRANLAARFMNEIYKIPVLFIIRNPYDVLHSQQRVKFPWLYNLSYFQKQSELVKLIKTHYDFDLTKTDRFSSLQILTIRWCIENAIPLVVQNEFPNKFRLIKYEALRNDIELFRELCDYFNLKPVDNLEEHYKKPSSKTHPKSAIRNKEAVVEKWKKEELAEINEILEIFKMTQYPLQN
tara:strand:+ start:202 stop:1053 length:852 start_codon:yes stop_codon:yes gene_type:complete